MLELVPLPVESQQSGELRVVLTDGDDKALCCAWLLEGELLMVVVVEGGALVVDEGLGTFLKRPDGLGTFLEMLRALLGLSWGCWSTYLGPAPMDAEPWAMRGFLVMVL